MTVQVILKDGSTECMHHIVEMRTVLSTLVLYNSRDEKFLYEHDEIKEIRTQDVKTSFTYPSVSAN